MSLASVIKINLDVMGVFALVYMIYVSIYECWLYVCKSALVKTFLISMRSCIV